MLREKLSCSCIKVLHYKILQHKKLLAISVDLNSPRQTNATEFTYIL